MEIGTITQIREKRDNIREKIKEVDFSDYNLETYGGESEYNFKGIIGGIDQDHMTSLTLTQENLLFLSGFSYSVQDFPWWDFDGEESEVAYFDNLNQGIGTWDKHIMRLNLDLEASYINNEQLEAFSEDLFLFPNPSFEFISLRNIPNGRILEIKIYDIQGKLVATGIIPSNTSEINFDVSNLESGIYNLILQNEVSIYSKKFVKSE